MKLKQQLAQQYDAPLNGTGWSYNSELGAAKKAARALQKSAYTIPAARLEEIRSIVKSHLGLSTEHTLTEDQIQSVADIDPVIKTELYMSHGQAVVSRLTNSEQLTEFIKMWRQHFLDVMQPEFLHPSWTVERGKNELRTQSKSQT